MVLRYDLPTELWSHNYPIGSRSVWLGSSVLPRVSNMLWSSLTIMRLYRCSALPTELWSHICWEQVNFIGFNLCPLRVEQHLMWSSLYHGYNQIMLRYDLPTELWTPLSNVGSRSVWLKLRLCQLRVTNILWSSLYHGLYWCSALPTELWSHITVGSRSTLLGSSMSLRVDNNILWSSLYHGYKQILV